MKKKLVLFMICLPLLLTACSGSGNISDGDAMRMEELGRIFGSELDATYIPIREKDEQLLQTDAVVVLDEKTYYIDRLYDFYEDYKVGESASFTAVFRNSSFVVIKVVFEGSAGYLFRYEFNPLNETEIAISSERLDKVEIVKDDKLKKVELTVSREKHTPKVFTFKNLRDVE